MWPSRHQRRVWSEPVWKPKAWTPDRTIDQPLMPGKYPLLVHFWWQARRVRNEEGGHRKNSYLFSYSQEYTFRGEVTESLPWRSHASVPAWKQRCSAGENDSGPNPCSHGKKQEQNQQRQTHASRIHLSHSHRKVYSSVTCSLLHRFICSSGSPRPPLLPLRSLFSVSSAINRHLQGQESIGSTLSPAFCHELYEHSPHVPLHGDLQFSKHFQYLLHYVLKRSKYTYLYVYIFLKVYC